MVRNREDMDYDPDKVLRELVVDAVTIYTEGKSLRKVADELDLNPIKVRKLLITAREWDIDFVYDSPIADEVLSLYRQGKSAAEIMDELHLSKASVNSYLPYVKPPYKANELSANAERIITYRKRKQACEKLASDGSMDNLWAAITAFQSYPFYTAKGLKFQYEVHGGEMKVDRKNKSITRSSVEIAYQKVLELEGIVTGPKKLGVFGASYLYPVFMRIGVIR